MSGEGRWLGRRLVTLAIGLGLVVRELAALGALGGAVLYAAQPELLLCVVGWSRMLLGAGVGLLGLALVGPVPRRAEAPSATGPVG